MLRFRNILIVTLATSLYTSNFGLDYRKTEHAYFHPPGPQYFLSTGTMYLSYPPLVGPGPTDLALSLFTFNQ